MEMGDTGDVGRRTGMFMSILAIGALAGPPISGVINTATGNFRSVGYYAGQQFSSFYSTAECEAHGFARHDRSCRRRINLRVALFRSAATVG